jgi:hypothetical protein
MAGHPDCDGDGHLPAVAARRAQVDRAHPLPAVDILWIHCVDDGGVIHVDGEGGQSIPIVDDGNNHLEVNEGLVAHFLGGALCSVRSHAVDKAMFCHKAKNGHFICRKSLVGESRTTLAGLSDEA